MKENDLTYWTEALAGRKPPIDANTPQPGYYRMRWSQQQPWLPVVIWHKGGTIVARVGDETRNPSDIWTYCADKPVAKDIAMQVFKTGAWPTDAPAAPTIGDNSRDLSLAEQIKEYAGMALAWLKKSGVKDAASKDMAANYRAELLNLRKRANAEREAKKRPHDEAAKAVQAEYKPLIDAADDAANELHDALTAFMRVEEARLQREAREKFENEQRAIAAARREVEEQRAKQMRDDPIAALTSPEPELPEMPTAPDPVKVQAGGQRGRKTGLRTVTKYVITDYAAALAHCKDHPSIREAVEKVCCAQARAGAAVPGVEAVTEKVAA